MYRLIVNLQNNSSCTHFNCMYIYTEHLQSSTVYTDLEYKSILTVYVQAHSVFTDCHCMYRPYFALTLIALDIYILCRLIIHILIPQQNSQPFHTYYFTSQYQLVWLLSHISLNFYFCLTPHSGKSALPYLTVFLSPPTSCPSLYVIPPSHS